MVKVAKTGIQCLKEIKNDRNCLRVAKNGGKLGEKQFKVEKVN